MASNNDQEVASIVAGEARVYDFQNERAFCTDGSKAKQYEELRAKGEIWPNVGEVCLAQIKYSADVQANPAQRAKRPDTDLLALYKAFAADKGYAGDARYVPEDLAVKVLKLYADSNNIPERRVGTVAEQPIPSKPGKSWVFTPGSAFDAAFSKVVLDTYAGQPAPLPQTTTAQANQLAAATEACFQTANYAFANKVTIGQCADVGKEQAAIYLAKKRAGASK